jgi:hypothetical protein
MYKNIISNTIKRVKQGHFMDGIFWSINDDFGTKRRIDFSQTLAKCICPNEKGLTNCRKSFIVNMVVGDGFEPSKAELTDLQSVPFDRSGTPPP